MNTSLITIGDVCEGTQDRIHDLSLIRSGLGIGSDTDLRKSDPLRLEDEIADVPE